MTSCNQKIITNEAAGPNSSSEDSERKGRTSPKDNTTHIRKEDHTRSETMVEKIHTICQDDSRYRPEQHDN